MAPRIYTAEQLLHLRNSPLVRKPDNLPAIEQWIEYVYIDKDSKEKLRIHHSPPSQSQQNGNQREQPRRLRNEGAPGEGSPMGSFGAGQRPSLMQTRASSSRAGDDVTLGPPKTVFSSSRHVSRLSDFGDKSGDATPTEEQEGPRSRVLGDKQTNRKGFGDREARDTRESWTARRGLVGEEEQGEARDKGDRFGRRDKDQNVEKRNGFGERQDKRWTRQDDADRPQSERRNDWRTRDPKDRRDRQPDRSAPEKDPEWMDEPARKQEDDLGLGTAHTQEDFQKWKEMMSGKAKTPAEAKESTPEELSAPTPDPIQLRRVESLKLEGVSDKPFGSTTGEQSKDAISDSSSAPAKAAARSGKASRFASMFQQPAIKEELPPQPTSPHAIVPKGMEEVANGSSEDKEGFQRILQMLGGTGGGQQASAPPKEMSSPPPPKGGKQKSRFTGFFDQAKSPERMQSPQSAFQAQFSRSDAEMSTTTRGPTEDLSYMFGGKLPDQPPRPEGLQNAISPEPTHPSNGSRDTRPMSGRPTSEQFLGDIPSLGAMTPDMNNIQNLLATQQRPQVPQQAGDKNSRFLLGLLQAKNPKPSTTHAPAPQGRPDGGFQLWMDQPPPETVAPKPRATMPPGLFEDQLLRNVPQEPLQPQRHDMPQMQAGDRPMVQRATSARGPPGLFVEEQPFYMQQQPSSSIRRTYTEPQPPPPQQQVQHQQAMNRRMGGHGNMPPLQSQHPTHPPEFPFLQSPPGHGPNPQVPPPGLPHMRHPPGFANIPNIFQAPQPQGQPQQPREPPGFGGMMSPPGAPPGFYNGPQGMNGPPGFMPMRGPVDGVPGGAGGMRGMGYEGYDGMGQRR